MLGGILIALGVASCSDGLAPELTQRTTPQFAKGGGGRGGGGNGGDSGPSAGKVITTFTNAQGDFGILSDGSPYTTIKKKGEVTSEIRVSGQHWLEVKPGPAGRTLCVAFPGAGSDAEILVPSDWNDFLAASGIGGLGDTYCGKATFHTRDHSVPEQFLSQDEFQTSGGKMVLVDLPGSESWEWRLMFDDGRTGTGDDQNGGIDRTKGLCINYDAESGTWIVGTDPTIAPGTECAGVDENVNLIRVTSVDGGVLFTLVAKFRMPFRYTLAPK